MGSGLQAELDALEIDRALEKGIAIAESVVDVPAEMDSVVYAARLELLTRVARRALVSLLQIDREAHRAGCLECQGGPAKIGAPCPYGERLEERIADARPWEDA